MNNQHKDNVTKMAAYVRYYEGLTNRKEPPTPEQVAAAPTLPLYYLQWLHSLAVSSNKELKAAYDAQPKEQPPQPAQDANDLETFLADKEAE
jgi:hypothetical protein